jgi:O-antigen ligase
LRTTFLHFLALVFLLGNLALRSLSLDADGGAWVLVFMALALLAAGLCWRRPSVLGPTLFLFGASFFLYGFHSYRLQSQLFEYAVTALALALLLRGFGTGKSDPNWPARFWLLYLLVALFSLLLLPATILNHRLMLGGIGLFPEILAAFPRDPLYPLAAVNRLALFVLFAVLLARGEDARDRYRALFRGIAWGSVACVLLGLLDFFGLISLTRYNLSRLFYGSGYQRLQSTFGNPTWFASFVTCTLPLILFELRAWGRAAPVLQGVFLPLCAAALFLSSVRASWLASGFLLALIAASWVRREARVSGSPAPAPARGRTLALAGTLASLLVLGGLVAGGIAAAPGVARRLRGLTAEMRLRGVASPRTVVLAEGLELVRESPLFGSGYETFNLHLRALLGIPASGVARVPNPAVTADPRDTLFDDAHSTYVQILAGTGALGLGCWLALSAVCLLLAAGDRDPSPLGPAVVLSMSVFHFYGFFQGMQYIPVIFFLFHLQAGYAMTVDATPGRSTLPKVAKTTWAVLAALVLVSPLYYWPNRGFRSFKEKYGLRDYLPEEGAEFEGFFGPEAWPQGEFRWMGRRGLINIGHPGPLRLLVACSHRDLERDPVFVSFSFRGKPAGMLRFDRPGMLERSFFFEEPGVLLLRVSRTWRPRDSDPQGDRRELGVAVSLPKP